MTALQPRLLNLKHPLMPKGLQLVLLSPDYNIPDPLPHDLLLPAKAHPQRRKDFLLGREAAYQALSQLSPHRKPDPIGRSERGLPIWPEGVRGSISHAGGWAVAVVGLQKQCSPFGVDLEHHRPSLDADRLARRILSPTESHHLKTTPDTHTPPADTTPADTTPADTTPPPAAEYQLPDLLGYFSAKESIFKALYPRWQTWIKFPDINIQLTKSPPDKHWQKIRWQAQGSLPELVTGTGLLFQQHPWIFSICWNAS